MNKPTNPIKNKLVIVFNINNLDVFTNGFSHTIFSKSIYSYTFRLYDIKS